MSEPEAVEETTITVDEFPSYPAIVDVAEQRRAFVLAQLSAQDWLGTQDALKSADEWARWLETGELPGARKLKVVKA